MSKTNWYVVTGAPSSGKTTLVRALETRGYRVVHEVARAYIEMKMAEGLTLEEVRADKKAFENCILNKKLAIEKSMPPDEVLILDRAVPDSIAYYEEAGLDPEDAIQKSPRNRYKGVFLLALLPYQPDHARLEDSKTAKRLDQRIERSYKMLGYTVTRIGVMPVADRLDLILDHIEKGGTGS